MATKIPEAIKYPRELTLPPPWREALGAHLTFVASEDFRQTTMVVPSPPFPPGPPMDHGPQMPSLGKDVLRKAALDARKAFVATLSDAQKARLEKRLAERLTALLAEATVVGGYAAIGSEISVAAAMEEARAVGSIVAYPGFRDPGKPFEILAGDPCDSGPYGILQPKKKNASVDPDVILVPLIAVDPAGTRLGRGKGHYDRALAGMRRRGGRLIGVGWDMQLLADTIPPDEWDVPIDAFAAPGGVTWFRT